MIASDSSNSGKTVVTTGLLQIFADRGYSVGALKCGPDYIDPMFHESVQGVRSGNIDLFLMGEEAAKRVTDGFSDLDIVLFEGVMGFYDGVAGTVRGSAYEIARLTDTPVILVIDPGAQGNTIAARVLGMKEYAPDNNIAGVILNRCSKSRYDFYKDILERENGLPVFGYLEKLADAEFESRHLGLASPEEIDGYREKLKKTASAMEETLDIDGITSVMTQGTVLCVRSVCPVNSRTVRNSDTENRPLCRIAVARDEAFSFYYRNSLEKLEKLGAELVCFSPMRDRGLPDGTDALYLGGGYPELHMDELSGNKAMRAQIKQAVDQGMPVIAECGGFLYLQDEIITAEGERFKGCGVFRGRAAACDRPVRFGYCVMKAKNNSVLFNKDEEIPAHEFHYWDTDGNGNDMMISKPGKDLSYEECFVNENLYAGFPHVCLDTYLPLAERFVKAAAKFRAEKER